MVWMQASLMGRAVWVRIWAAAFLLVVATTPISLTVLTASAAPAVGSKAPSFPATPSFPAGGTQETSVRPRSAIAPSAISRPAISRSAVADFPPVPGAGNAIPTTENAVPSTGNAVVSMMTLPGGDTPAENGPAKLWLRDAEGEWTPTVLLRKVVRIDGPISGSVQVFADSDYEIHCNGKLVASGKAGESGTYFDVTGQLRRGDNVLAIQAQRVNTAAPGIGIRLRYHTALTRQIVETDSTWVAAQKALPLWRSPIYSDRTWQEAVVVPRPRADAPGLPVPAALTQLATPAPNPFADTATNPAATSAIPAESEKNWNTTANSTSSVPGRLPGRLPSISTQNATSELAAGTTAAGTVPADSVAAEAVAAAPIAATAATTATVATAADRGAGSSSRALVPITRAEALADRPLQNVQLAEDSRDEASTEHLVAPIHYTEQSQESESGAVVDTSPARLPTGDEIELRVPEQFTVEAVAGSAIGSLIKIEFDEFGRLLASRETGGLIRIDLSLPLDSPARVTEVCDKVSAIQGILPLNGSVYVTGVGPDGLGIYHLQDTAGDGRFDEVKLLCGIEGQVGEHGPHALQLGTDRMIYVLLGNHAQLAGPLSGTSPLRRFYEGDLLPRYEDPSGHAAGIKAPGGTLVRLSLDGRQREVVSAGIRNAYSFAFNQQGDIFLHDSDMESDEGTSWYRPTQVYHAFPGADFGWRSGWAKWPPHYLDATAPIARTGRGSPSGAVVYDHVNFPRHYHNAFFTADWAAGRILAVRTTVDGASYTAELETFMEGRPLNATDLAVGPQDGALYIALGGRQSTGGIYRVRWTGEVPAALTTYTSPWEEIIRAPMFYSAATRQRLAVLKQQVSGWDETLRSIATNTKNIDAYRTRALDIMQWFGPAPTVAWLTELSQTESSAVRRKVAAILGVTSDPAAVATLVKLLADPEPVVQRIAAEGLLRTSANVERDVLTRLLESSDPVLATLGRRILEKQPLEQWESWITEPTSDTMFPHVAIAGLTVQPSLKLAYDCLVGVDQRLTTAETPEELLALLRVTQLALKRGQVDPTQIPAFVNRLAELFPADDSRVHRELTSILAYTRATQIEARYVEFLRDETRPELDRWHLAMQIQQMGDKLSLPTRLEILEFLEQAKSWPGGGSYQHYVMLACRDLGKTLPADQALGLLQRGAELPNGCLMLLAHLPKPLNSEVLGQIATLEQQLVGRQDPSSHDLKIGLTAILGESLADANCAVRPQIAELLIQQWKDDPNRRPFVTVAMAQATQTAANAVANGNAPTEAALPPDHFWTYFLRSLPVLNGFAAEEVFRGLLRLDRSSQNPEHLRQVILVGLRHPNISGLAIDVLEKWSKLPTDARPGRSLVAWQSWFAGNFPQELPAALPSANESSRWTVEEIQKQWVLLSGDTQRGRSVYQQASCANCHVYQDQGQAGNGPDLNGLVQRFSQREIIESILHPSLVISDRYRSEVIQLEDGRVLTGIVSPLPNGRVAVIDSQALRTEIDKIDIQEMQKSPLSIMPAGLIDPLDAQQVVDLLAYLLEEKRERTAAKQ